MSFAKIEEAIAAIQRGEIVVVVDDEDRENEGDLIMAAEKVTPERMAFMIRHTSGVICQPMLGEMLDRLRLPLMVSGNENTEGQRTAFTVSVGAVEGTTTGISAGDRATTVLALIDPSARRRSQPTWSHLSASLPGGRSAQTCRTHRSRRRPSPTCGAPAVRHSRGGHQ